LDVLHQRDPGLESLEEQKKALCCLGTTRISPDASGVGGYSGALVNPVRLSSADRLLAVADHALRALTSTPQAARPMPAASRPGDPLDDAERRRAGALMRVNHVGEVCAQALYSAQALATADPALRRQFEQAAGEETDHLAWTAERLAELGARPSLLNPLWYAGAFAIGLLAARAGDARSLGFLIETERQVERHLESHLERLPAGDLASRAIVAQMKDDEAAHAMAAEEAGGTRLPAPLRWAMRAAAKVMTTTAHYV
jgi:3-demethoxyubiquinol 3-hydroxylase